MKMNKIVVIVVIVIVGLLCTLPAILPTFLKLNKSISIKASQSFVFTTVSSFDDYHEWDLWYEKGVNPTFKSSVPMARKDTWISWESEQGNGMMMINESEPNDLISGTLALEGFASKNNFLWRFEPKEEQIEVSLFVSFYEIPYFSRLMFFLLFTKPNIDLDVGLNNLKEWCESRPSAMLDLSGVEYQRVDSQPIIYIRDSAYVEDIYPTLGKVFDEIVAYTIETNATILGMPFARWERGEKGQKWVFEAGFPAINEEGSEGSNKRIIVDEMIGGNFITAVHYGAHSGIDEVYDKLDGYLKNEGLLLMGTTFEVYMTGPATEPDTSKWETRVFYPVNR